MLTSKYATCKNCHENFSVSTAATDRVELERDKGPNFPVVCSHCHDRQTIHVNKVKAKPNLMITTIIGGSALVLALLGMVLAYRVNIIVFAALPFLIPGIIYGL